MEISEMDCKAGCLAKTSAPLPTTVVKAEKKAVKEKKEKEKEKPVDYVARIRHYHGKRVPLGKSCWCVCGRNKALQRLNHLFGRHVLVEGAKVLRVTEKEVEKE